MTWHSLLLESIVTSIMVVTGLGIPGRPPLSLSLSFGSERKKEKAHTGSCISIRVCMSLGPTSPDGKRRIQQKWYDFLGDSVGEIYDRDEAGCEASSEEGQNNVDKDQGA